MGVNQGKLQAAALQDAGGRHTVGDIQLQVCDLYAGAGAEVLAVAFVGMFVEIARAHKELVPVRVFQAASQGKLPQFFLEAARGIAKGAENSRGHAAVRVFAFEDHICGLAVGIQLVNGRSRHQQLLDVCQYGKLVIFRIHEGIAAAKAQVHG